MQDLLSQAEEEEIKEWIHSYSYNEGIKRNLITILLAMQTRFGYLPTFGLKEVACRIDLPLATVYGVATFYNQFRFGPPGKYAIKVCTGTACHIKQANTIIEHWERNLKIKVGEVTPDKKYSLDRIACVGCCTLAPVNLIGDEVIGGMSPSKVDGILLRHRMKETNKLKAKESDAANHEQGSTTSQVSL